MLIPRNAVFSVVLRNSKYLSILCRGLRISKLKRMAALELFLNTLAISVKVDSPVRFLKIIAFRGFLRDNGFLPVTEAESR